VLADGARLTVRQAELGLSGDELQLATLRTPQRLLVDGRGRVPLDAPFFQAGAARVAGMAAAAPGYAAAGHDYLALPGSQGQVDLAALLTRLGSEQVNDVLVEAGPRLAGAFAQAGLVDEYHLFLAPRFLGSSARPLLDWPLVHLAEAPQLEILSVTPVGADLHLIARPARDT
jgi:diaminohydroxyphosphoribosylaminopyrimidine deaminase/5-amino-6-(5-phosphoribosylamino)uracil reductase